MKSVNLFCKNFLLPVFAALLLAGCAGTALDISQTGTETPCITEGWPHDTSDLRPDPSLHFGRLANGLRYVIMHNEEPEDRVGMYLNIQAGSLDEKDEQRGYAHFLEHMLFNGTTHYPPGTLVEYFQSIGMAFGSDTNAHTSYNETVYRLLLPDGTEKNLRDGLLVMADYARGALLLEDEVERERGIILAEKRTRDSAGYRLYEKRTRFSFAGTRIAERFPIGTEETLRRADAASLRSFYDSWYRPQNMFLIVVGDVERELVEKLIVERFGPLTAPPVEPTCYDFGAVAETGDRYLYIHEPELGSTEISINSNWNILPEMDSVAAQQEEMRKYIASLLLRNRLHQLVREAGSPLTKGDAYSGQFLQRVGYATVHATVDGDKWRDGFELLTVTLRQSLELGFSARELERVKKEVMADLRKEVQTAASRDSRKIAGNIIGSLNRNDVFLSPQQELDLYGPVVESVTIEEANTIFREIWGHAGRDIIVAGTAVIAGDKAPEESIREAYELALRKELPPWHENNQVTFPYLQVPENGAAVSVAEHFAAIDMDRVTFANGTVLNVKKTSFQPNEVLMEIHFGAGKQSETVPGLGMLAESVVNESGVGRLSKTELEDALAGQNIRVSFKVGQESFSLAGEGLSSEIELLLDLARTRLLDPAFRNDAYRLAMERIGQMYEQMSSTVEGMMQLRGERFLAGGNPHYGMPLFEAFNRLALDQVREWLSPVFAAAPLEISIVGDIDPAGVQELVGRYFGNLDRQYDAAGDTIGPVVFPAGENLAGTVVSRVDKALVTVAWPTDDFWDITRTRRLTILAAVFEDRLRLEIRERLGAVYSPQVFNNSSRTEPGYGVLRAMLTVDPAVAEDVAARVRQVAMTLAGEGVTREELTRSLEPALTSIKDIKETNRYWMGSVMALSGRHPRQLEWPKTFLSDYASITAAEISAFAARYLDTGNSAAIIFKPEEENTGN